MSLTRPYPDLSEFVAAIGEAGRGYPRFPRVKGLPETSPATLAGTFRLPRSSLRLSLLHSNTRFQNWREARSSRLAPPTPA